MFSQAKLEILQIFYNTYKNDYKFYIHPVQNTQDIFCFSTTLLLESDSLGSQVNLGEMQERGRNEHLLSVYYGPNSMFSNSQ